MTLLLSCIYLHGHRSERIHGVACSVLSTEHHSLSWLPNLGLPVDYCASLLGQHDPVGRIPSQSLINKNERVEPKPEPSAGLEETVEGGSGYLFCLCKAYEFL